MNDTEKKVQDFNEADAGNFTLAKPLDHDFLLFLMWDRIMKAAFDMEIHKVINGVNWYVVGVPDSWKDEQYRADIIAIEQKCSDSKQITRNDKNQTIMADYEKAREIFRAMTNLLDRRNKLGEKNIEEEI